MYTYMQLLCVGITRYPRAVGDMETSIYHPLGVANKGGLETKFEETAGRMTVGHIRSYKFVRFGLKGLSAIL